MRYLRAGSLAIALAIVVLASRTGLADEGFSKDQVKAMIEDHIAAKVKEGSGVYIYKDDRTGEEVALEFVRLRFIRGIKGQGYIGSVDFRAQADSEKLYDIDFWIKPQEGKLVLMDIKTHRYPEREGGKWVQVRVDPIPWWWAVAQEHPGDPDEVKGWVVKAAIHEYVAQKSKAGGGVFTYMDEKTGRNLDLEFVKIHDPVTRTKQGYFACTDFRVKGEPEKLYDLDFWLNERSGALVITQTRLHKEPAMESGKWVKKPRYGFDKDGNPVASITSDPAASPTQ